jgi:hypothetical protein
MWDILHSMKALRTENAWEVKLSLYKKISGDIEEEEP